MENQFLEGCERRRFVYISLVASHGPVFATEFIQNIWRDEFCIIAAGSYASVAPTCRSCSSVSIAREGHDSM